jgi:hypothetical protein
LDAVTELKLRYRQGVPTHAPIGGNEEDWELFLRLVAKVLEPRRWEQRAGPFQGFGSPPGKF